jgi:hypothetical protein
MPKKIGYKKNMMKAAFQEEFKELRQSCGF